MKGLGHLIAATPPLQQRIGWADAALAVVVAVVLLPESARAGIDAVEPGWTAITVAALVGSHLSVLLRRHPLGLLMCALAMLILVVAELEPSAAAGGSFGPFPAILLPSALTFPVVLYAAAVHLDRPWPAMGLVIGIVGAAVTAFRLSTSVSWPAPSLEGFDPASLVGRIVILGALVALVVAPWALGRYRAVRAAYLAELEARAAWAEADRDRHAAQAAAEERTRIAREMHDVVAHALAVIVRQAEGGRLAGARDPDAAIRTLGTVADTGRTALDDTRSVLGRLRDNDQGSLPQEGAEHVETLVARLRETGLPVELEVTGTPDGLARTTSLAIYRVVQESLTNVVKHGGSDARASVRIMYNPAGTDITISNQGSTADVPAGSANPGHGVLGMRERIELEGGALTAEPTANGFVVHAAVPSGDAGDPGLLQEDTS